MKEFLELANTFRNVAIVEDDFLLWRDRFDAALTYLTKTMPKIVCLCGSTRFWETFRDKGLELTLKGHIVLSIGICAPDSMVLAHPESNDGKQQKTALDELHKRKIDLCDEVLVLNVGGYIGDSTRSEIQYAVERGKRVCYLEGVQ